MNIDRITALFSAAVLITLLLASCKKEQGHNTQASPANKALAMKGEPLFMQYCANCHPDGENVSDPLNNLRKSTLKAKHIDNPEDIIAIMRKPASRMITFDVSTLSDQDARAIAEYILETF